MKKGFTLNVYRDMSDWNKLLQVNNVQNGNYK